LDDLDQGAPTTANAMRVVLSRHRHLIVLAAMVGSWWWTFYQLGSLRHDRYWTFGFDLGLFNQAAWLVAHGGHPFMTIRGLDVWGHHGNFIFLLFAPLYWLGAGPKFLLAAQLCGQCAGAVGIYLLARDLLQGARWMAVVLAGALLAHPSMQFLSWEFFHPESLAIGPIILAYWAARIQRWRWFWLMAVLAMACKEDVTTVFIMLGIVMICRRQVRMGATIAAVAAGWYLAVTKVLIPWRNPAGPFYEQHFFANYGGSIGSVIATIVKHPSRLWRDLSARGRVDFYVKLWAPVAFVPFLAPEAMVLMVPMFFIVALASIPWVQDYRYHYMAIPLAVTFIAVVEAVARLGRPGRRRAAVASIAVASLAGTIAWGVGPSSQNFRAGYWPLRGDETVLDVLFGTVQPLAHWPKASAEATAVAMVPRGASVSASFNIDPHLSDRRYIYEWPNPWIGVNWGICNDHLADPGTVDWIVVDTAELGKGSGRSLFQRLTADEFQIRFAQAGVVVAERVHPSTVAPAFPVTRCPAGS